MNTHTGRTLRMCSRHKHVYTVSCALCDMEAELAERRKENSEGLIRWLSKLLERGDTMTSLEIAKQAERHARAVQTAEAWSRAGELYHHAGERDKANQCFLKAGQLDGDEIEEGARNDA